MAHPTKTAPISFVLLAAAVAASASDRQDDRPTVFVHIENLGGVMPETVSGAQHQLTHVFDAAGVRIESSADPDHDRCLFQPTVHVVLLRGALADRFIKTEQVNRKALAQANSDARRVYVFWDRVGPAVDRQAVAHGDALGLVIAHELGHVLLPGRGHSPEGLMQANYNVYLSYGLKFSIEESAAMLTFISGMTAGNR